MSKEEISLKEMLEAKREDDSYTVSAARSTALDHAVRTRTTHSPSEVVAVAEVYAKFLLTGEVPE